MRLFTRLRRRWLVWWAGRWCDRYVRCYECGAVSRGKRAYHVYRGFFVYARWLGCGHAVQPSRYGYSHLRLARVKALEPPKSFPPPPTKPAA